jgi:hypothetical protein
MTEAEATTIAGLIQRAFPHRKLELRFYIKGLLKFDAKAAKLAVLDAVEDEWRFAPSVYEMMLVLRRSVAGDKRDSCHHAVSMFDRCEKCEEEAG